MILADIETFNIHYGCAIVNFVDPMKEPRAKEILKEKTVKTTKPFNESHNPVIFDLLNFDVVKANCRYFTLFLKKFDKAISV